MSGRVLLTQDAVGGDESDEREEEDVAFAKAGEEEGGGEGAGDSDEADDDGGQGRVEEVVRRGEVRGCGEQERGVLRLGSSE